MARGLSSCGSWALEHGLTVVADGLGGSIACGIFPDQGSNLCLLHKQAASLPLSHQESPAINKINIYIFLIIAGLSWWLSGKEAACLCRRHRFDP